jgi:catechol 2,3-dioxygenase-like lactoylglutathione lyase family enzyme
MSSLNATTLGCSMTCKDIAASIRWYEQVLGFQVAFSFEKEGKVFGAAIVAGDIRIILNQDDGALGWDRI